MADPFEEALKKAVEAGSSSSGTATPSKTTTTSSSSSNVDYAAKSAADQKRQQSANLNQPGGYWEGDALVAQGGKRIPGPQGEIAVGKTVWAPDPDTGFYRAVRSLSATEQRQLATSVASGVGSIAASASPTTSSLPSPGAQAAPTGGPVLGTRGLSMALREQLADGRPRLTSGSYNPEAPTKLEYINPRIDNRQFDYKTHELPSQLSNAQIEVPMNYDSQEEYLKGPADWLSIPDYQGGNADAEIWGPNLSLLYRDNAPAGTGPTSIDPVQIIRTAGYEPSGDYARDTAFAADIWDMRQQGLDPSPVYDQEADNKADWDRLGIRVSDAGIYYAQGGKHILNDPVAIVNMRTGKPEAIAGEAGPEKIEFTPLGKTRRPMASALPRIQPIGPRSPSRNIGMPNNVRNDLNTRMLGLRSRLSANPRTAFAASNIPQLAEGGTIEAGTWQPYYEYDPTLGREVLRPGSPTPEPAPAPMTTFTPETNIVDQPWDYGYSGPVNLSYTPYPRQSASFYGTTGEIVNFQNGKEVNVFDPFTATSTYSGGGGTPAPTAPITPPGPTPTQQLLDSVALAEAERRRATDAYKYNLAGLPQPTGVPTDTPIPNLPLGLYNQYPNFGAEIRELEQSLAFVTNPETRAQIEAQIAALRSRLSAAANFARPSPVVSNVMQSIA